MRILLNRSGAVKPVVCIAVLFAASYAGFKFSMPYYRYSAFKSEVTNILRLEIGDSDKVKAHIYGAAQEYGIPVEEKEIELTKETTLRRVKASWAEDVDILGLYKQTLYFDLDVEG